MIEIEYLKIFKMYLIKIEYLRLNIQRYLKFMKKNLQFGNSQNYVICTGF